MKRGEVFHCHLRSSRASAINSGNFLQKDEEADESLCLHAYISCRPRSWKSYDHPPPDSSPLDGQMHRNLSLALRPLADVGFG